MTINLRVREFAGPFVGAQVGLLGIHDAPMLNLGVVFWRGTVPRFPDEVLALHLGKSPPH